MLRLCGVFCVFVLSYTYLQLYTSVYCTSDCNAFETYRKCFCALLGSNRVRCKFYIKIRYVHNTRYTEFVTHTQFFAYTMRVRNSNEFFFVGKTYRQHYYKKIQKLAIGKNNYPDCANFRSRLQCVSLITNYSDTLLLTA